MKAIAAYEDYSLFLDTEGRVWYKNWFAVRCSVVKLDLPEEMEAISVGQSHIVVLSTTGTAYSWGYNSNGQLGIGANVSKYEMDPSRISPHQIIGVPPFLSVACGEAHTVFLDFNGGAWACGSNVYAQLCLGDTVIRYTPEKIPNLPPIQSIASARSNTLLQDINGSVWLSSFRLKKPRLIKNLPPIYSKTIAVKAARKV